MKTLLKWVFPAILSIVPTLGMEDQQNKAFLSHEDATYRVMRVSESGSAKQRELTATVEATMLTHEKMQREIPVVKLFARFLTTNWAHNDDELYANEKIKVYINLFKDGAFP